MVGSEVEDFNTKCWIDRVMDGYLREFGFPIKEEQVLGIDPWDNNVTDGSIEAQQFTSVAMCHPSQHVSPVATPSQNVSPMCQASQHISPVAMSQRLSHTPIFPTHCQSVLPQTSSVVPSNASLGWCAPQIYNIQQSFPMNSADVRSVYNSPTGTYSQPDTSSQQSYLEELQALVNQTTTPSGSPRALSEPDVNSLDQISIISDHGLPRSKSVSDEHIFTTSQSVNFPSVPGFSVSSSPSKQELSREEHYRHRRLKNNAAARRSRELRKKREENLVERIKLLEDENSRLKLEVKELRTELDSYKNKE